MDPMGGGGGGGLHKAPMLSNAVMLYLTSVCHALNPAAGSA